MEPPSASTSPDIQFSTREILHTLRKEGFFLGRPKSYGLDYELREERYLNKAIDPSSDEVRKPYRYILARPQMLEINYLVQLS